MNTDTIILNFYQPDSKAYKVLVEHSRLVANKAVETAKKVPHLKPDIQFIEEAAMLHDIGIFKTHAPDIGCYGEHPYLFHGFLGRELLEELGLPEHALVSGRHTGTGITSKDIRERKLGLPVKDMVPVSIEEQIICYADKFYSKTPGSLDKKKSVDKVIQYLHRFGGEQAEKFKAWVELFGD